MARTIRHPRYDSFENTQITLQNLVKACSYVAETPLTVKSVPRAGRDPKLLLSTPEDKVIARVNLRHLNPIILKTKVPLPIALGVLRQTVGIPRIDDAVLSAAGTDYDKREIIKETTKPIERRRERFEYAKIMLR